jgi:hypothetical protein
MAGTVILFSFTLLCLYLYLTARLHHFSINPRFLTTCSMYISCIRIRIRIQSKPIRVTARVLYRCPMYAEGLLIQSRSKPIRPATTGDATSRSGGRGIDM